MRSTEAIPLTDPDEQPKRPDVALVARQIDPDFAIAGNLSPYRPIDYKFLVIMLIALSICIGGVVIVHGMQMRRVRTRFLTLSEKAHRNGDFATAARNLSKYLLLVPDDIDARYRLALALDQRAKTPKQRLTVYLNLEAVVRADPKRSAARRKLVGLAMEFGRYQDAIKHLDVLLTVSPDDADLLLLKGDCLFATGKLKTAATVYEAVLEKSPRRFKTHARLASLLQDRLDSSDKARIVLNRMVVRNRDSFEAYLTRARFLWNHQEPAAAISDAAMAYRLGPSEPDVLLLVAEIVQQTQITLNGAAENQDAPFDVAEIKTRIEAVLERFPHRTKLSLALAQLEVGSGEVTKAVKRLREAWQAHPDQLDLQRFYIDVLIHQHELDAARRELAALRRNGTEPTSVTYLEGRLAMAEGDWLLASRKFASIRLAQLGTPKFQALVNINLARCCRRLGHTAREIAAYRRAEQLGVLPVDARLELAETLLRAGKSKSAMLRYQQLIERPGVASRMAQLLIREVLRRPKRKRDWTRVEQMLSLADRDPANLVDVLLLRARVLTAKGDISAAGKLLRRSTERHPGQVRLWVALAGFEENFGSADKALRVLDQARAQLGNRIELWLDRVRIRARVGDAEARAALTRLESDCNRFSPAVQGRLLRALATAYQMMGDLGQAARCCKLAVKQQPNDLESWRRLVELALRRKDSAQARKYLAEIRRIEGPDGPYWRLGEAARHILLAENGQPEGLSTARRLLKQAAAELQNSPRVSSALARVEELDGNEDGAVDYYAQAIDQGETDPRVVARLIRLLNQRRQFTRAADVLRTFQERSRQPLSGTLEGLAVEVAVRTKDFAQVLELAQRGTAAKPRDVHARIFLGQALWAAGKVNEAERALRAAVQLDQTRPGPWIALVNFLAQTRQNEQAQIAIREAAKHLTPHQAPLALARCFESVGNWQAAEKSFGKALRLGGNTSLARWRLASFYLRRGLNSRAQELLAGLVAPGSGASKSIVRAARRGLAIILSSRSDYHEFQRALALLDRNTTQFGETTVEDLSVRARVLASQPIRRHQLEAIRTLKILSGRADLTSLDQFRLARLHAAVGKRTEALRMMHILVLAGEPDHPEYRAAYIRMLLDGGEFEEAAKQAQELDRLQPTAFRTAKLRAEVLVAQNKLDAAIDLLNKRLAHKGAASANTRLETGMAAAMYATLSRKLDRSGQAAAATRLAAEAERLFQQVVPHDPRWIPELARLQGDRGHLNAALDLCETAWKLLPPQNVAPLCYQLLVSGQASPEQIRRVQLWLDQARRKHPQNGEFVFQLANLASLRRDYAAAERLHREAIQLVPKSVWSRNELAVLLALRSPGDPEALRLINKAIELAGPLPYLLDTRATVYLTLGKPQLAVRDSQEAAAGLPNMPAVYFHLCEGYLAAGDRSAARIAYRQAVAAGLHVKSLYSLERPNYERVRTALRTD